MTVTIAAGETSTAGVSAYLPLLARLGNGERPQPDWSAIVDDAVGVWARPGFDTFLAIPRLRFEPFDYQLRAARTVLRRMRGRGILADEVGLGKTIEAGLVASELRMRGLADRVLVIVPAGLVDQWRDELERKFGLPTAIAQSGSTPANELGMDRPVTIASLAAARRDPLLGRLTDTHWDLVIVDEAHRLRNPRSASGTLARTLRARYLLMLTATPVENKLSDLYQLVSLVAPGLLGTPAQFRAKHGAASVESSPHNAEELRARTREVMVRHRRSEVAVMLPQRLAETVLVTPGADEAGLYAAVVRRIRAVATGSGPGGAGQSAPRTRLALRGLTRLAGSSPAAAAPTLTKLGWNDLAERARAIREPDKMGVLVETREKYRASHQARPYRLHVCEVPVWRLPVDVRRGDRRYPLTLDWLIPLARFTDIGCPHCGADERLVATKTRLGCAGCVPRQTVRLAPEPPRPPAEAKCKPAGQAKPVVRQPPTPSRRPSPVRTNPRPTPVKPGKLGDKLTAKVWEAVVRNDRRLARLCAPDSPAAAAIRLYGPSGAAWAVGLSPDEDPVAAASRTTTTSSGLRHSSDGYVETAARHCFPFLLRWQVAGDIGQIEEILPYGWSFEPAHLSLWVPGPGHARVYAPPEPWVSLGPVGELLWRRVVPTFGLPAVLRCLAALWRLPGEDVFADSHGPAAVAAGIERMVCHRANLTTGRFADIAAACRVTEAAVRAANAGLQKCLRLGPDRWW